MTLDEFLADVRSEVAGQVGEGLLTRSWCFARW